MTGVPGLGHLLGPLPLPPLSCQEAGTLLQPRLWAGMGTGTAAFTLQKAGSGYKGCRGEVTLPQSSQKGKKSQAILSKELNLAFGLHTKLVPCGGRVEGGVLRWERPGLWIVGVLGKQLAVCPHRHVPCSLCSR